MTHALKDEVKQCLAKMLEVNKELEALLTNPHTQEALESMDNDEVDYFDDIIFELKTSSNISVLCDYTNRAFERNNEKMGKWDFPTGAELIKEEAKVIINK